MQLSEKHRPRSWSELAGHDKVKKQIDNLRQRGLGGRAFFISGKTGNGKTTIARLIAREVASENAIVEVNAKQVDKDFIEDMERSYHYRVLAPAGEPTGRAFIINEVHGLRKDSLLRLLTALEPIEFNGALPPHVVIIFTTTKIGAESLFEEFDDAAPLINRCAQIKLQERGQVEPLARRLKEIAVEEGIDGKPIEDYVKWFRKNPGSDMRAALQALDSGTLFADEDE